MALEGLLSSRLKRKRDPEDQTATRLQSRPSGVFPSEIYDHNIDHLWDEFTTLLKCSLVCRAWLPTARYQFMSRPVTTSSAKDCTRLLAVLNTPGTQLTDFAHYIRILIITSNTTSTARNKWVNAKLSMLMSKLPNLRTLYFGWHNLDTFDRGVMDTLLTSFPNLEKLRIFYSWSGSYHNIIRIIHAYPTISSIRVDEFDLPEVPVENPIRDDGLQRGSLNGKPACIRELTVTGFEPHHAALLAAMIDSPKLDLQLRRFACCMHRPNAYSRTSELVERTADSLERLSVAAISSGTSGFFRPESPMRLSRLVELELRVYAGTGDGQGVEQTWIPTLLSHIYSAELEKITFIFSIFKREEFIVLLDWNLIDEILTDLHVRCPRLVVTFQIIVARIRASLMGRHTRAVREQIHLPRLRASGAEVEVNCSTDGAFVAIDWATFAVWAPKYFGF
ncbi:hypothetical protein B0H21DRAFT_818011 [Amylocystis lapponica]|nr:hypothetical protein B0H21DRAFT_818011 [Amylocystis lapponica]